MYLKRLGLLNFKNIAEEELTLCPGINCLVGDNGAGKTNVVDAVYYLSMCKSSLQTTDGQSIRHGADFFLLEGQYQSDAGKSEQVVCSFSRKGGKVVKRNGKEYERLADHVGLIPAVIVSPADSALISDSADERRRYLNAFISQLDRPYLAAVMRYNAVLAERNRLLKMQPDEVMLGIYDRQLVEHGEAIHARRREFVERLRPVVADYYAGMETMIPLDVTALGVSAPQVASALAKYYAGQPMVKVHPLCEGTDGGFLAANKLAGKDTLEIYCLANPDGTRMQLISLFDNLGKGSSGAAVQCMNIMLGLEETKGLEL